MTEDRVESCLFFTGTPHGGKPYGFWSLMALLQPELFSPRRPESEQLPLLRPFLIRNFKQKVTDMAGKRLFQPVVNYPETYSYSAAEADFYQTLTRFIMAGNAYASGLPSGQETVLTGNRETTAAAFNQGRIRFLVSTEAATTPSPLCRT
ncbi:MULTISPECIES: hypothetical protein [unclassified Thiocapsa]|uniref:hypothetical protein n=1 Tax=unclassified Thiocapsa TaxID=2641286 RepID=UPI0035B27C7E